MELKKEEFIKVMEDTIRYKVQFNTNILDTGINVPLLRIVSYSRAKGDLAFSLCRLNECKNLSDFQLEEIATMINALLNEIITINCLKNNEESLNAIEER